MIKKIKIPENSELLCMAQSTNYKTIFHRDDLPVLDIMVYMAFREKRMSSSLKPFHNVFTKLPILFMWART